MPSKGLKVRRSLSRETMSSAPAASAQARTWLSVTRNDLAAVEQLLNGSDVDVNYRTPITGENALGTAAASNNPELIELLLRHGANPNIANKDGMTPYCRLHIMETLTWLAAH